MDSPKKNFYRKFIAEQFSKRSEKNLNYFFPKT